jgi:6-phosphogluconolactonase
MSTTHNLFASAAENHSKYFIYIGTYGKGVQAFRYDAQTVTIEPVGLVGEVVNPSWITADQSFKYLYAVSELEGNAKGGVASFEIDRKTGKLNPLNHIGSEGVAPCYAAVDATSKTLVVANYTSGGVSAFPIEQNGSLGPLGSLMTAEGSSINKDRQEGPHAHEAVISHDNERVYVPDLGLDKIRIYRLESTAGKLTPNDPPFVSVEAGHGPRHIIFDKKGEYAYVINELKPLVSVFSHDASNGNLKLIQTIPTLPADFTKKNTGAEIRLDHSGKFLYTSNRGNDSLQVFAIDPSTGKLQQVQNISTEGKDPRGFALDPTGRLLFVGNQNSNNLVVFKIDSQTGKLTPAGQKFDVPSPVDVLFVPAS